MNQSTPSSSEWIVDTSASSFDRDVIERSQTVPVVVDFWASWCQPCRLLAPILEALAVEFQGAFILVKAETESMPEIAARFGISALPTVLGFRGGDVARSFAGMMSEDSAREWIRQILPTEVDITVAEAIRLESTDPAAAVAKYREAITCAGSNAQPKIKLAELFLRLKRIGESGELIAELEERGFLEPEAERVKSAMQRQREGQQVGTIEQCRAAVAEDSDDLGGRLKLAEALAAQEQYEEALEICVDLVQRDRTHFRDTAKQVMLDIFRLLPDDSELLTDYRRKLSSALY